MASEPYSVVNVADGVWRLLTPNGSCLGDYDFRGNADHQADLLNSAYAFASSAAADEVGRLREACRVAMDHILELEEAWRSGALSSCDGQNGTRSNRNVEVRNIIRTATDASGAMKHTPTTGGQGEGGKQ